MRLLYSFGIRFYTFLVWLAAVNNQKAKYWLKGRRNWKSTLQMIPQGVKPIWIHCSSLGEFEQGRPLIEALKKKYPNEFILLTFYSPSGYEVRKYYEKADLVMYLPTDTLQNARTFVKLVNPKLAVFIKYEFWFNYLKTLHNNSIPLYSVSAIFRESQIFFKLIGIWFRKHLAYFSRFFVQNDLSMQLLVKVGIDQVSVCGDTRYDRVHAIAKEAKSIPEIDAFAQNEFTVVAGSTWAAENEMIVKLINSVEKIKVVVAPHELHEKTYNYYEDNINGKVVRLSQTTTDEVRNARILLVDSIGLLSSVYRYGQLAIVGGGFGKGIHNILEPAVYGIPVIIGPKYSKFYEAVTMSKFKLIHPISDFEEFKITVEKYFNNKEYLAEQSEKITAFVEGQLGATNMVLQAIESKLVN